MTYSVTNREAENHGSLSVVYATVDITSLENAGNEPFDARDALGISGASRYGISVRGVENDGYLVRFDHLNDQFHVQNIADETDVAAGTDVGEVLIEATGV
jgi:hypothetical protein